MNKKQIQQGDVLLKRIDKLPKSLEKINHLILAEGETTGHAHVIEQTEGTATLFKEEKGNLFLLIKNGQVVLKHQEHKNIIIDPGIYKIGRVLEYDWDSHEQKIIRD